jgi:uncharacterized HAD superfamily protein
MEKDLLQLIRIIREELDLYKNLVEKLRKKTDIIVEGNMSEIIKSTGEEEAVVLKIRMLENELITLCGSIATQLGIPFEGFTLSGLADKVAHGFAHQLRVFSDAFSELISEIRKANRRNMILLNNYFHYANVMTSMIYDATTSYENSGILSPLKPAASSISQQA